ncbi:MAG: hypothetical protein M1361_02370 [Patescibacteria group bacterium]|nr:hypothetical protein [Patescibacteria group bacterium]MCL5224423.1 hypothetical protein [Patescibacteria group bacterium]
MFNKLFYAITGVLLSIAMAPIASAHEVYVLSPSSIAKAVNTPSFSLLGVISQNLHEFVFWAFIGILIVFCVLMISTSHLLERKLDPLLVKIKRYAPFIARFTIGISFLACAYYQATFGPELPLSSTFGSISGLIAVVFAALGVLAIVGLLVRPAAFTALVIFGATIWVHGVYMLTYVNYLGEIIVLLILGAHSFSLDTYFATRRTRKRNDDQASPTWLSKAKNYLAPRSFAILRVLFGTALVYASAYAKIIHNNLALFTVERYHLDKILGFEPHFLVLGAALVELTIGLFFVLGFEIRFTSTFLLFWLTLSLIFFGEIVWPHLILIGIPIAYIFYGYDRYSLEGWLFKKSKLEPIL